MKNILILFALLLTLIASGSAQLVTVDYLITANNTIVNSEVVTVTGIPLTYNGTTRPELIGVRPDSMRLEWRATATGDSIRAYTSTAVNFMGSGLTGYTNTLDTILVAELSSYLIPRSVYASADEMAAKITALSAGNTLTGSNKLWMHVRQYFHLPMKR